MTSLRKATTENVLVWRETLLPYSETFILNQATGLTRWNARLVGAKSETGGGIAPARSRVLYGSGTCEQALRRGFKASRRSMRLDSVIASFRPKLIHAHFGTDAALIA